MPRNTSAIQELCVFAVCIWSGFDHAESCCQWEGLKPKAASGEGGFQPVGRLEASVPMGVFSQWGGFQPVGRFSTL